MDLNLIKELKKQISYLERSSVLFDQGMQDEAPRIATTLRVLIHETQRSRSLLGELGIRGKTKLLSSSCFSFTKKKDQYLTCTITGIETDNGVVRIVPQYDRTVRTREIKAHDWWEELIFGMTKTPRFSRKDFVLFSANKDGGAHVDKYPKKFKQIKDGDTGFSYKANGQDVPLTNTIECAIRQMAYEIINSPEIINLIR
jgi:hypothetical protein